MMSKDDLSLEEASALLDDDLTLEEAEALLAQPDAPRRRVKKALLDERTLMSWIKLEHHSVNFETGERYQCEVPGHDESRPRDKGMVVIINEIPVCRLCFLNEVDRNG